MIVPVLCLDPFNIDIMLEKARSYSFLNYYFLIKSIDQGMFLASRYREPFSWDGQYRKLILLVL